MPTTSGHPQPFATGTRAAAVSAVDRLTAALPVVAVPGSAADALPRVLAGERGRALADDSNGGDGDGGVDDGSGGGVQVVVAAAPGGLPRGRSPHPPSSLPGRGAATATATPATTTAGGGPPTDGGTGVLAEALPPRSRRQSMDGGSTAGSLSQSIVRRRHSITTARDVDAADLSSSQQVDAITPHEQQSPGPFAGMRPPTAALALSQREVTQVGLALLATSNFPADVRGRLSAVDGGSGGMAEEEDMLRAVAPWRTRVETVEPEYTLTLAGSVLACRGTVSKRAPGPLR